MSTQTFDPLTNTTTISHAKLSEEKSSGLTSADNKESENVEISYFDKWGIPSRRRDTQQLQTK